MADRIAGTQIPVGSRIIAVADIYDKIMLLPSAANMDARKDIALTHLRNNAGVLYDPRLLSFLSSILR